MLFKCCLALISVPHTWFHGDWFLGDDTIQVGGSGAFAQIDQRHVLRNFRRESDQSTGRAIFFFVNSKPSQYFYFSYSCFLVVVY